MNLLKSAAQISDLLSGSQLRADLSDFLQSALRGSCELFIWEQHKVTSKTDVLISMLGGHFPRKQKAVSCLPNVEVCG